MSDLISRKRIRDYIKGEINSYGKPFEGTAYELGFKIMRYIDAMDSDYDLDKVVEELEKASKDVSRGYLGKDNNKYHKHYKAVKLSRAIEIVKNGGVSDDVCEWKLVSDGEFIKNPHTKRLYSNEPSMRNVYCNTCGKKIKIVGD